MTGPNYKGKALEGQRAVAPRAITAAEIKRGRERAQALSTATDALNQALVATESAFQKMALGVVARVPLQEGLADLAFKRLGDTWRLVVERNPGGDVLLVNAPRHLRVKAPKALEALLDALLAALDTETQEVEGAIAAGVQFVEALKQAKPPAK